MNSLGSRFGLIRFARKNSVVVVFRDVYKLMSLKYANMRVEVVFTFSLKGDSTASMRPSVNNAQRHMDVSQNRGTPYPQIIHFSIHC